MDGNNFGSCFKFDDDFIVYNDIQYMFSNWLAFIKYRNTHLVFNMQSLRG